VVVVDFAWVETFAWALGVDGRARPRINEAGRGEVDTEGVDTSGSERFVREGVVSDGSAKFGIKCVAPGVDEVEGDTSAGSERLGTGTPGELVVDGLTSDGSSRFGASPDTLGIDEADGLTNDGSERFGASPDTPGIDEAVGATNAGKVSPPNGRETEGVAGEVTVGALMPEPESGVVATGREGSFSGIVAKSLGTRPVASLI
jgi:hypothetical protein